MTSKNQHSVLASVSDGLSHGFSLPSYFINISIDFQNPSSFSAFFLHDILISCSTFVEKTCCLNPPADQIIWSIYPQEQTLKSAFNLRKESGFHPHTSPSSSSSSSAAQPCRPVLRGTRWRPSTASPTPPRRTACASRGAPPAAAPSTAGT